MAEAVNVKTGFKVTVTGEHREGICRECNQALVKEFYMDGGRRRVQMACPKCGKLGKLIAKTYSVQPPNPPQCLSFKCLYKFFMDTLFCALLSNYHSRRVAYAEKNRHKEILERYRTGEPSPKTIWQAIHANIKLKCPICRKYNKDPLLFRR
jgi:phage FluMu protein Com